MLYPFKFKPLYKSYVWGGRNLSEYKRDLPDGKIAESWEVSCHTDGESVVQNGELEGISLNQLINSYSTELLGANVTQKYKSKFPLLVKLIDANDKLSVQVHPDDKYAMVHSNEECGKNEVWYILEAKPGAKIIYSVVPGTTKEEFVRALNNGCIEKCLNSVEVKPGEVYYIPAGTVHAIGEGIVLAEIQQNSNLTYRLFDYNRVDNSGKKRELHIDKALDVINFDFGIEEEKSKVMGIRTESGLTVTTLVSNSFFEVEKYAGEGILNKTADGFRFYIYTIIGGSCTVVYNTDSLKLVKGESVLIPANLGQYSIEGKFEALKVYVPDV